MSNNGKQESRVIMNVVKVNGKYKVGFVSKNIPEITMALKLANLELDNAIIGSQAPEPETIVKAPNGIIDRLK